MPRALKLAGERFGQLKVIKRIRNRTGHSEWLCRCDCGNEKVILGTNLRRGATRSCGCLRSEIGRKRFTTHGLRKHPLYRTWGNMKSRCYNKRNRDYKNYGGRGVKMSKSWRASFEQFYKDMGERPSNHHSIDRKNNEEGYNKSNCRWATKKEQADNRRNSRGNIYRTYREENLSLKEWARRLNVKYIIV